MRPVLEGTLSMIDLRSDRIGLYEIGLLNDALDVRAENERRQVEGS